MRKHVRLFYVMPAITLALLGSGCFSKKPKNPALYACQEENVQLRLELNQKNERLRKFNQIDSKGQLRNMP